MIRFTAVGHSGPVLGLGLSFANLDLLREGRPIQFDVTEHALNLVILECDAVTLARAVESMPSSRVIGLTPRTIDTLRAGEVVTVSRAASQLPADVVLFAGETELAILESMQSAKLVGQETSVQGMEEYHRHEANAVEGCTECEARRRTSFFEWIFAHPYMILAVIVATALIAGLIIEAA
jgi:hypothetical protein